MHLGEYFIVWVTFIAINATNLEIGMGIGIVVACLGFIFQYAYAGYILQASLLAVPPLNSLIASALDAPESQQRSGAELR